jgi:phospholipid/cholesterol/gamma-HCH transport system substrate-binding protein
MKNTKLELSVGLFVLLGIAAIAYLTIQVGTGAVGGGDTYLIESRFTNAGGIHPGSSVMVAGVTVGRVEGVRIEPSDFSAIVAMRVLAGLQLPTDSMASIKTTGLIGDKFISLLPGADATFLKPGMRITLTESAIDLESLIGRMAFGSVNQDKAEKENK